MPKLQFAVPVPRWDHAVESEWKAGKGGRTTGATARGIHAASTRRRGSGLKAALLRQDQHPLNESVRISALFGFWSLRLIWILAVGFWSFAPGMYAAVLNKDRALARQTFWDNRDFDWYKANIPFFECPDPDIVTTYYYRWEVVTKHLTYGSPKTGYTFTEFIDRPFWSGAYGAISCPAGHQLYEVRWLAERRIAQDYARYWFHTEGAQPRRYSTWLADAVWATHLVQDVAPFATNLLADLIRNYEGWEKSHFVPEVGLFWQVGHDDGMEFNIASRQTKATFNGAPSYRPSFNAYMWADAQAISRIAELAGDPKTATAFRVRADALKAKMQEWLWDPKRQFFLIRFKNDEECDPKNWPGQKIRAQTFIYEDGPFAGSPEGRELIGYVPWQFNMVDRGRGFESSWKFLMDPKYFYAPFGPSFVGRNDPLFKIADRCCWWSGQSWPYANSQTLTALANLLQNYEQKAITREDYVKLLGIYARTHRKDGRPYIAEAAHPDTGSWEGHDGYNHSEHYFHSSFNDLVITGLMGLKPRSDDLVEIDPLAPSAWDYFALEDIPYHGRKLSILWDRDGKRYGKSGLRVMADGREIVSAKTIGKISGYLPPKKGTAGERARMNFAVNNDGDYFPRVTASFSDPKTSIHQANDGNYWYHLHPPNRWTAAGSTNAQDWIVIDFGTNRRIDTVKLYFLDDRTAPQRGTSLGGTTFGGTSSGGTSSGGTSSGGTSSGGTSSASPTSTEHSRSSSTRTNLFPPASYELEFFDGRAWKKVPSQKRTPREPEGRRANTIQFPALEIAKLRVNFNHGRNGRAGLTEIETWGDADPKYKSAPPPAGNLALGAKATASFWDRFGGVPQLAIDGKLNYRPTPVNRWTSFGSSNATDWLEITLAAPKEIARAELYIYDDRGGVQAPADYTVEYWADDEWREAANQQKLPPSPAGNRVNEITFSPVTTQMVRFVFKHKGRARSGVTELMLWER